MWAMQALGPSEEWQRRPDGGRAREDHTSVGRKRGDAEKLRIFRGLFSGLNHAYGTYDPSTGDSWQVKQAVTDEVILAHLAGRQPFGLFLLVKDQVRAIAVDFDSQERQAPLAFVTRARHYGLQAYIEISKSKGYHGWVFFEGKGVSAGKARLVVRHILDEIGEAGTEVFPKQDALAATVRYGNFINAPLFGRLVPQGKTVFIDPATFDPIADQWALLESVQRHQESVLDDVIALNDLEQPNTVNPRHSDLASAAVTMYPLPPCARKMLRDGVSRYQRVSCFRLAVHFRRMGLPGDVAIGALKVWALKNRPQKGKRVITDNEIVEQVTWAFDKEYRGYGCRSEAVAPFCLADCPVIKKNGEASRGHFNNYGTGAK